MIKEFIVKKEAVVVATVLSFIVNQIDQLSRIGLDIEVGGQAYIWLAAFVTAVVGYGTRFLVWSEDTVEKTFKDKD